MFIAKFSDKNYLDLHYLKNFLLLFFSLYVFNYVYTGLLAPDNMYSPFLDHYLNYVNWLRSALLFCSNILTQMLGMHTMVVDEKSLHVLGGRSVIVGIPCLGLGVMIFWISFILSAAPGWKTKTVWCLTGLAAIWVINIFRVAFILIATQKSWNIVHIDHHTAFNVIAYLMVFFLIFLFFKRNSDTAYVKTKKDKPEVRNQKTETIPLP
jgi:exosortase/archaeosortase family protein